MDHLQSDIDSLELEKGELRDKLMSIKKRSLYDSMEEKTAAAVLSGKFFILSDHRTMSKILAIDL